ncbi:MAG: GSU2403 family nucleotidyltransferase fold protein, partial [Desulfomonilaceae bacterium]
MGYQKTREFLPDPVARVFSALCHVGFFEHSVLVGSWAMFYYRAIYDIPFAMLTSDIDIAIQLSIHDRKTGPGVDIEKVLEEIGATPVFSSDGLQRFIIPAFQIEFLVHEKVKRTKESSVTLIREWKVHAQPLPFIRMLLDFSERIDSDDFYIRIPLPEAFFFHKLIIAQRRQQEGERRKDLDQCRALSQ